MKVFLDTNVIMDYLAVRQPFFADASLIVDMCERKEIQCVISTLTVINCAYILRKAFTRKVMFDKIQWMINTFDISRIDKEMIQKAASASPADFEDAVQIKSAISEQVDIIITRDPKGFIPAETLVQSPSEFLANCMK